MLACLGKFVDGLRTLYVFWFSAKCDFENSFRSMDGNLWQIPLGGNCFLMLLVSLLQKQLLTQEVAKLLLESIERCFCILKNNFMTAVEQITGWE